MQHYVEVEDMVHMAMKVERQLKWKGTVKSFFFPPQHGSRSGAAMKNMMGLRPSPKMSLLRPKKMSPPKIKVNLIPNQIVIVTLNVLSVWVQDILLHNVQTKG